MVGLDRTLINFLVNFPNGKMFKKYVDAFTHIKDAQLLSELFVEMTRNLLLLMNLN